MKMLYAPLWGLLIFVVLASFHHPQLVAGLDDIPTDEEVISTSKKRKIIRRKIRRRIEQQREESAQEEQELTEIPPPHEELRPEGIMRRILRRISRTQTDASMMPQTDWAESHDTYKTIRHFNTFVQENNRQYDAPDPRSEYSTVNQKRTRNPE